MQLPAGVIFDMDGVIVDSHPVHRQAWRRLLSDLGKEVSDAELEFVCDGQKREDILRHFLGELSEQELRAYGHRKDELFQESALQVQMIPGFPEFLSMLEQAGIPAAVATSGSETRALHTLDRLRLTSRFAAIVTGTEVANGKPHPEIFLLAAERLRHVPSELLVVEDSGGGVRAAKSAGMRCLGLAVESRAAVLVEAGADAIATNFIGVDPKQLPALFNGAPRPIRFGRGTTER